MVDWLPRAALESFLIVISLLGALWLNDWAARDLGVAPGADVRLDYFAWLAEGRLESRSARFRLAGIVPLAGGGADVRDLPRPRQIESYAVVDLARAIMAELRDDVVTSEQNAETKMLRELEERMVGDDTL